MFLACLKSRKETIVFESLGRKSLFAGKCKPLEMTKGILDLSETMIESHCRAEAGQWQHWIHIYYLLFQNFRNLLWATIKKWAEVNSLVEALESTSMLKQVVARIQFTVVVGLRSWFSFFLNAGHSYQLLESTRLENTCFVSSCLYLQI